MRNRRNSRYRLLLLAGLASLVTISQSVNALAGKGGKGGNGGGDSGPSYTIVQLDNWGYFTGDESSGEIGAFDISDVGNVVGAVYDPLAGRSYGAFWEVDGSSSVLTPLSGGYTAYALNNANEIVGWSGIGAPEGGEGNGPGSVFWPSPTSDPIPLPALTTPYGFTYARGINDCGIICGWSRDPEFDTDGTFLQSRDTAVIWRVSYVGGQPQISDPIPLPTPEDSRARALTECDVNGVVYIVGGFAPATGRFPRANAAVRWRVEIGADGALTVDPQPTVLEWGEAEAFATNNIGATTGQALIGTDPPKGQVWVDGIGITLADPPTEKIRGAVQPALDIHAGFGINDSNVVVGSVDYARYTPDWEAAVWLSPTAEPLLLKQFLPNSNAPFDFLRQARSINTSGVIAGTGTKLEIGAFGFIALPQ